MDGTSLMDYLFVFDRETTYDENYKRFIKRYLKEDDSCVFFFHGENEEELLKTIQEIDPKIVVCVGYFDLKHRLETTYKNSYLKNKSFELLLDKYITSSGKYGKSLNVSTRHGRYYHLTVGNWSGYVTSIFHPVWMSQYPGTSAQIVFKKEMEKLSQYKNKSFIEWSHSDAVALMKEKLSKPSSLDGFKDGEVVAWDIETTSLAPFTGEILSMSIVSDNHVWCERFEDEKDIPWDKIIEIFKRCSKVIVHNISFEYLWQITKSKKHPFDIPFVDTMALRRLEVESPKLLSLEESVFEVFGANLEGKDKRKNLKEMPTFELRLYNTLDSFYTLMLYYSFDEQYLQTEEFQRMMRLAKNLCEMWVRGMLIDKSFLKSLKIKYENDMEEIKKKIDESEEVKIFGEEFNPNSSVQIKKLAEVNQIDLQTTQKKEMVKLNNSFLNKIIELRELTKNLKTYTLNIEKSVIGEKLHVSMNPYFVVTGRLSSIWHNIPKRKSKDVRGCVVADEESVLVEIDYAQLEARGFAMVTKDPVLTKQIFDDFDIHAYWANRFLEEFPTIYKNMMKEYGLKTEKEVKKYFRGTQKTDWVFSSLYGASWKNCWTRIQNTTKTKLSEKKVENLQHELLSPYKKITAWQQKMIHFYDKNGYVESITGRKRWGPMTKNEFLNTLIQGPSSDIVTRSACIITETALQEEKLYMIPLIIIHDALVFRIPLSVAEETVMRIIEMMVTPNYEWINVPLKVEATFGVRWSKMDDFGTFSTLDFPHLQPLLTNNV